MISSIRLLERKIVNREDIFMMKIGILILCFAVLSTAGSFKDKRDGQIYKTVKIGNQVWMAQNLNYSMRESTCYDLSNANCRTYGRLYTWNAAQFACPNGWHLPDTTEWIDLFNFAGGYMVAGKKLKSKRLWQKHFDGSRNNGDDSYGFSALPGGQVTNSGTFFGLGFINGFWTSSRYLLKVNYQTLGTQYYDYVCVATFTGDVASKCSYCREWEHYFSVRCVKD